MHLNISVDSDSELLSFIRQLVSLEPEQELTSLIRQIISLFKSMNWEQKTFICLHPQVKLSFKQRKVRLMKVDKHQRRENKCRTDFITMYSSIGKYYFHCEDCNGEDHGEYEKAPVEVKHSLHPKHSLQLVLCFDRRFQSRRCSCCDKDLEVIFYYCSTCDFAMKVACVERQPFLSVRHLKWHEHTLSLFPRHTSLTCDACALTTHSTCLFYICPPCDFVVHQSCMSLPRVIRISRHPHRISFTLSFDQRDWSCSICRKKIDNRYGGYSCFKGNCSYAAHSRCATQRNVWDGIDLEGLPEEIEEELEPFVRISDGIIQHFSHQQHHLRLEENEWGNYDENKLCQACITPIYFGNFNSCMQCEFILHENCATLSRKIYHPIHPHMLTLVGGYDNVDILKHRCSACELKCTGAFVYECNKEGCRSFRLNMQCATISEPLVYEGHMHPLFLTSKPGDERNCSVCESYYKVTFNCIKCACDFALCFRCATIPQNVRYKHDVHMLTLSYGEETKGTMKNWCEACEKSINPKKGFYKCDEYCCVTLHIKCLLGNELYMNPGYSYDRGSKKVVLMRNNQHMSRPFCSYCKKRCLEKLVFKVSGFIFCRRDCETLYRMIYL